MLYDTFVALALRAGRYDDIIYHIYMMSRKYRDDNYNRQLADDHRQYEENITNISHEPHSYYTKTFHMQNHELNIFYRLKFINS